MTKHHMSNTVFWIYNWIHSIYFSSTRLRHQMLLQANTVGDCAMLFLDWGIRIILLIGLTMVHCLLALTPVRCLFVTNWTPVHNVYLYTLYPKDYTDTLSTSSETLYTRFKILKKNDYFIKGFFFNIIGFTHFLKYS